MRRNIKLDYGTDTQEFEHYVGRRPKKGEMDDWVHYLKKGVQAQLDWEVINRCAAENFGAEEQE